jgi:hypothetical protein
VGFRYATCKAGRLRLRQELGLGQERKVLELPKRRLGTRRIRDNQSIEEIIQQVGYRKSNKEKKSFSKGTNSPLKYPQYQDYLDIAMTCVASPYYKYCSTT